MTENEKEPRRPHTGRTIRKETAIDASPDTVWKAWAEPERIAQWFVDRAEGSAEVGGVMRWIFDTYGFDQPVQILAAEPGQELVITGEVPGKLPFLQEIRLEKAGGKTILRLLQSGFADGAEWDDEYEGVDSGWEMALATLRHWLETYGTSDRGHLLHMRPARFEYEALQPLFDTARGLESWLAVEAELRSPLRVGDPVRMRLGELGNLEGRVLCRTPREVLLSWPAERAVLALKCFGLGPRGRMVALDFNAWPLEPARRTTIDAFLVDAIDRLVATLGEAPKEDR